MKRVIVSSGVLLFLSGAAFGQAATTRREFDVAEIKLNRSGDTATNGGVLPGGQFSARNFPLKVLLGFAFGVSDLRLVDSFIVGAPSWVDSNRFDITGKSAPGTSDKMLALMLQVFLEKQFKLRTHQEQKPMNVFALVLGKGGPKLQDAAVSGEPDCKKTVGGSVVAGQKQTDGQLHAVCTNMRLADLVRALPDLAPAYFDRPVLDLTGLMGAYDLKLDWTGRGFVDQGGLTIFDSVDKLGLKLEERKLPVPVIVVDHIEKLADDN
jgi:uncharacterized protein (TIGR03435 family)